MVDIELLRQTAARLGYREKYAHAALEIMATEDQDKPTRLAAAREYEILISAGYLQSPLMEDK